MKKIFGQFNLKTAFLICVAFISGILAARPFYNKGIDNKKDSCLRQTGYKFTNPLLECNLPENTFSELKPFKDKLEDLANEAYKNNTATMVAVYFRDLNNGPWFGFNEGEVFAPASLFKVPVMVAYLKLAETNPAFLQTPITPTAEDLQAQASDPTPSSLPLEAGKTYTAEELIRRMIVYSDNASAQLLVSNIDAPTLAGVYKDFGIDTDKILDGKPEVDVKTYAGFFRILFNSSYLSRSNSEWALGLLSQTSYNDGLVAGLPDKTMVAHKYGIKVVDKELNQLHDCGIIYYPGHPYLLCVMTRGKNIEDLQGVIKNVSGLIYNELKSQLK